MTAHAGHATDRCPASLPIMRLAGACRRPKVAASATRARLARASTTARRVETARPVGHAHSHAAADSSAFRRPGRKPSARVPSQAARCPAVEEDMQQAVTIQTRRHRLMREVTDMRSSSVTRRKLLKRAGVGAAALGAGSLVTAGTASAIGHCHDCACDHCPSQSGCDPHVPSSACFPTTEGCCYCGEGNVLCDSLPACDVTHDCPPGWACTLSCCSAFFGYGPLCIPPPGVFPDAGAGAADGPRAAQAAGAAQGPDAAAPGGGHGHQ